MSRTVSAAPSDAEDDDQGLTMHVRGPPRCRCVLKLMRKVAKLRAKELRMTDEDFALMQVFFSE